MAGQVAKPSSGWRESEPLVCLFIAYFNSSQQDQKLLSKSGLKIPEIDQNRNDFNFTRLQGVNIQVANPVLEFRLLLVVVI
jgi:hypothetical protein